MARLSMLKPRVATLDTSLAPPPPKVADSFYTSPEWIALRDQARRTAKGRCQRPGCGKRGHIVDHIVEIKDGGARLDPRNVELLCSSHHTTKTNDARARRQRGEGGGGVQKSGA